VVKTNNRAKQLSMELLEKQRVGADLKSSTINISTYVDPKTAAIRRDAVTRVISSGIFAVPRSTIKK
jgi:hypothetical protein